MSLFAYLYRPPAPDDAPHALVQIAEDFSPRYERVRDDGVVIDLAGLQPLFGDARAIGAALQERAQAHGLDLHIAIAGTQTAACVAAQTRKGLTVIAPGEERHTLAPLPIDVLAPLMVSADDALLAQTFKTWGLRTLGQIAALPRAELRARAGSRGAAWQTAARGEDVRPLVPTRPDERFEETVDLEWPIEGLEPLSFVLMRLLEPLSLQLERRDRGVATIHLALHLVTRDTFLRHLTLPVPMRDARTLRTLLLLDVEAHPPSAAIDRVTVSIDPTPARVLQHTLFAPAQPAPEQISTLLARLGALMGSDRIGTPIQVDTDRPGAFAMRPFRTDWTERRRTAPTSASPVTGVISAFRQYRPPLTARVVVDAAGEPVHVSTDRGAFDAGRVLSCTGPWATSGAWWNADRWHREEWDVRLSSGVTCRLAHNRDTGRWCIDAVAD